ncbi:MAG: 50S ribosomal protein L15 [Desulfovibrio sp.]|nr:50S ribosomal protein L15 [Desulfovibrio sp.]
MQLHDLHPFPEERKQRRRVGRGTGSGLGGTSGRGHKGQNARSGGGVRPGFEGGQMPLQRRLPKHGFKNALFKTVYQAVDLDSLQAAFPDREKISLDDIYSRGLAHRRELVKILSRGEVAKPLEVEAHRFSAKAAEKIIKAGGKVSELLGGGMEVTAEADTQTDAGNPE